MALTEKQWNEIYDDIYALLWKYDIAEGKTEQECKEIMEKIKEILMTDDELIKTN